MLFCHRKKVDESLVPKNVLIVDSILYKSGEDMYEPAKSFRPLKKLDESPVPKNVSLSIPSFAEVMKMCTNLQGRFGRRRRWTSLRF